MDDFEKEIERLKQRKTEIATKISLTTDFNVKEELEQELSTIASQIKTLEIFKKRMPS
jgi:predicted  nucleic acid-binding Zn-ribbon protein